MTYPRDVDLSTVPMTTCPNLTHLFIHAIPDGITSDEAIEIWSYFPALKEIELHPCAEIQSSLVATDYLRSMKVIGVEISHYSLELTYQKQGSDSDEIGIARLCLLFDSLEDDPSASVSQILRKHCNTLQQLYLKMNLNNDDTYDVHYPQLKKLALQGSALWIPRNTPMLEELSISSKAIRGHPAILDTIPPNLRKLELQPDSQFHLVDKAPVEMYLHHIVQHYQLKDMSIYFHSSDSIGTVLDAICHLGQLRSLVIYVWKKWNCNQMEEFFNKLVIGCSHLRVLRINCNNAPSTRSISTLKQLGNLEQLAFSINGIDNNCRFWSEVKTFPQLKHIWVYFAEGDSNTWISYLKRQRPDIKISKDSFDMRL
ncbi:hypothetical protein LRAMOSA08960 [Lichtheimia ramosa]|uniref:F-box domain-containing protein n=1 Tax=Lichtheimia ramosa TaxID=688394 RepID=A0A077WIH7_9FUNG|nr:hypothetical protein LRAMOSA08960 [Lichtheimia ramosa]